MKPVICFGEALIDFLNIDQVDDGCLTLNNYRQFPGGAPANAAVAVAKLGGTALFAGQVGDDPFGDFLTSALQSYQVNTEFLSKHPKAKTALAFVMLDQNGERTFSFHRHETADMLFSPEQVNDSWFSNDAIFHFCSNTLTEKPIALCTQFAVNKALASDAIVSFDVNLRHNLWANNCADITMVNRSIVNANVIKFSMDELEYLAQGDIDSYLQFCFEHQCQLILVTDGAKAITCHTPNDIYIVKPPIITAVDTTAGGDGFIGGFLYALSQFPSLNILIRNEKLLINVIEFAAQCGAIAVSRAGAFPALATIDEVLPQLDFEFDDVTLKALQKE